MQRGQSVFHSGCTLVLILALTDIEMGPLTVAKRDELLAEHRKHWVKFESQMNVVIDCLKEAKKTR